MKRLILIVLAMGMLASCGKKQDDIGAQFTVKSMGDFQTRSDGTPTPLIAREDENAGPTFKLEGDLTPIQYFDKTLNCGPVTLPARRAIKTDVSFQGFKVSESEFHGMNQLPQHVDCTLSITSTNANGSTVTKNTVLELKFDSTPSLKINRRYLAPRSSSVLSGPTVPMESYEINNPFSYPVNLIYRNSQSFTSVVFFKSATASRGDTYANLVDFQPSNVEYTGSFETGYHVKVPANSTITITAMARLVGPWGTPECPMDFTSPITGFMVMTVNEPIPSLVQTARFDFSSEDLTPGRVLNRKQLTEAPFSFSPTRSNFNCPPPQMGPG